MCVKDCYLFKTNAYKISGTTILNVPKSSLFYVNSKRNKRGSQWYKILYIYFFKFLNNLLLKILPESKSGRTNKRIQQYYNCTLDDRFSKSVYN